MSDPQILAGRRGLVVGFSHENSFGYRCIERFVGMGAEVVATYRPPRAESCGPLAEQAGCAAHYPLDVLDTSSMDAAFAKLGGALDFLVHTTMHAPDGLLQSSLLDVSRADFELIMSSGSHALVELAKRAAPLLERSPAPRILTFTFAGSRQVTPTYHVAGICKAALEATVRYLAAELGPRGISVNALGTSMLPTDLVVRAWGDEPVQKTRVALEKRALTRRPVQMEDVTRAAATFVSPLLTSVTGEILEVDGGFSHTYF